MTNAIAALREARRITIETAEATGMHRPALIHQIDAALASAGDEVTVEELAQFLDPRAFHDDAFERHKYCSPLRVEVIQDKAREKARALLSKFHIHKRAEG